MAESLFVYNHGFHIVLVVARCLFVSVSQCCCFARTDAVTCSWVVCSFVVIDLILVLLCFECLVLSLDASGY
jgi:hypothetical protein